MDLARKINGRFGSSAPLKKPTPLSHQGRGQWVRKKPAEGPVLSSSREAGRRGEGEMEPV